MSVLKILSIILVLSPVDAEQAGRRRRNRYNDRPCGPGQHAILSKSKKTVMNCATCPTNTYCPDTMHSIELCLSCEAGRVSSSDFTYCIGDICKAGTHGTIGSITCTQCEIGKYSVIGQFSCIDCESGRYNNAIGKGICIGDMCQAGKYGLIGQIKKLHTACSECPEGKWSVVGASLCNVCPDGTYSFGNAVTCTSHDKCPMDMYYSTSPSVTSNKTSCTKCMHYSVIYSISYFLACLVVFTSTIMYLHNCTTHCYMLVIIIPPLSWLLALTFCNGNPKNSIAIVSIIMNSFWLIPPVNALITTCNRYYKEYCDKPSSVQVVKKNSMGKDTVVV